MASSSSSSECCGALRQCDFVLADMNGPEAGKALAAADVVFSYSTAFPTVPEDGITVEMLSRCFAGTLREGCLLMTVDTWVADVLLEAPGDGSEVGGGGGGGGRGSEGLICHFELLEDLEGFNDDFGAGSSVYLWKVSYRPPTAEEVGRKEIDPESGTLPLFVAT